MVKVSDILFPKEAGIMVKVQKTYTPELKRDTVYLVQTDGNVYLPDKLAQWFNIVLKKCFSLGGNQPRGETLPFTVEVCYCLEVADERWPPHVVILTDAVVLTYFSDT